MGPNKSELEAQYKYDSAQNVKITKKYEEKGYQVRRLQFGVNHESDFRKATIERNDSLFHSDVIIRDSNVILFDISGFDDGKPAFIGRTAPL